MAITLNGSTPVELTIGTTYTELGAATDVAGGSITTSGTVSKKVGSYTITYTEKDNLNAETGITSTRTVNVVAKGAIDTIFDIGDESRTGESTIGTAYDILVDKINAGNGTSADFVKAASISDETALDPYELKYSK